MSFSPNYNKIVPIFIIVLTLLFSLLNYPSQFPSTDTEGSFVIERVIQVAEGVVNHLKKMTVNRPEEEKLVAEKLTVEAILSHIHYYRVHDYVEQIALINVMPTILQQHPQVTTPLHSINLQGWESFSLTNIFS